MAKYSVEDSETFTGQRALLERSIPRLAEALNGLKWALERKPYKFDKIEEVSGLRLAKLEALEKADSKESLSVRVFFKLLPGDKVELQWMETFSSLDF